MLRISAESDADVGGCDAGAVGFRARGDDLTGAVDDLPLHGYPGAAEAGSTLATRATKSALTAGAAEPGSPAMPVARSAHS